MKLLSWFQCDNVVFFLRIILQVWDCHVFKLLNCSVFLQCCLINYLLQGRGGGGCCWILFKCSCEPVTPCAQLWAGDTVCTVVSWWHRVHSCELVTPCSSHKWPLIFFSELKHKEVVLFTFTHFFPEETICQKNRCNVLYRMFVPCERLCTLYVAVWTLAWCHLIMKTHRVISRFHILLHCSTIFCLSLSYTWNPNNLVQCQYLTWFWCVIQHFSWILYQKGARKEVWIGHAAIWSLSLRICYPTLPAFLWSEIGLFTFWLSVVLIRW